MNYAPAQQDPIIENDLVVAWVFRVRIEADGKFYETSERWDLPENERYPMTHWTPETLAVELRKCSESRNMNFKVMKQYIYETGVANGEIQILNV